MSNMLGLSHYAKSIALDAVFTGATTYIALLTTLPTDELGTGLVEASVSGYARVAYGAGNWTLGSTSGAFNGGDVSYLSNVNAITFPALGASLAAVGWAIYSAATGGNLLMCGQLTDSGGNVVTQNYVSGDQPSFGADALQAGIASVT